VAVARRVSGVIGHDPGATTAPSGCSDEQPSAPVWTGTAVVIFCPDSTASSGGAGLVFTTDE
jgi:hypothetical protein